MIHPNTPMTVRPPLPKPVSRADDPGYLEAVYSGVLGKLIGVYLGRPVENWSYDRIAAEIGDVDYYIHDKRGRMLIVTDDDISGTFTFLRALEDYGFDPALTSEQIGQTWLNYLIENTTILWWGGLGNSTEHTAYLRLKDGISAPKSGSSALNSVQVAEQIGAQIFIDGWGMVCPGDPERAAWFAEKAARVSHDGEAVYGAQVVAALVAAAFTEKDIVKLLELALRTIPGDCTIARVISDLRQWHASGQDWRKTRQALDDKYGYHVFPGQCPIVPNHGVIVMSLLHGDGDFDRSLMIANTAGWDTDCNSGNVGAILGVRNGLAGLEGKDWRGPVADRLYIPSADGGRSVSDAVVEAVHVTNAGRRLASLPPVAPKDGARFHFSLPGSVQGWTGPVANKQGRLVIQGPGAASTPTFIPPEAKDMQTGYVLVANPTLFPSQTITADLVPNGARVRLFVDRYDEFDQSVRILGEEAAAGQIQWTVPETGGQPIHAVGIQVVSGTAELDSLTWGGVPTTSWPALEGTMWARAWVNSLDRFKPARDKYEYLVQNHGRGMLTMGARDWRDYRFAVTLIPRMADLCGVALRSQGLRRHYAFLFTRQGTVRLEKELDGRRLLAEVPFRFEWYQAMQVEAVAVGPELSLFVDGQLILQYTDPEPGLASGALGFVVEGGCMGAQNPGVRPA